MAPNALHKHPRQPSISEKSMLEAAFRSSYDGLFIADARGSVLMINPSCERVFGMTAHEAHGLNAADLERTGTFYPSATMQVLARRKPTTVLQQTKSGDYRLVTANPVFDDEGNIVLVVGNSRDLTEIMELKNRLQEGNATLKRLSRELSELRLPRNIPFIAVSATMKEMQKHVRRVAASGATVLVLGESGVGKDVIARLIHEESPRRERPFVKVNCASIPEALLESELFGYEKGAFTGASQHGKPGLIELAEGGTLFLDEIGDLPLASQSKLLRVLEERRFTRVGGTKEIAVNVRWIAATNQDLQRLIELGRFRADLFYRLSVVPVWIPPLRERKEDILPLANAFLAHFCLERGVKHTLSQGVRAAFESYSWPGNVRELQNLIEQLVVCTEDLTLTADMLPPHVRGTDSGSPILGPGLGRISKEPPRPIGAPAGDQVDPPGTPLNADSPTLRQVVDAAERSVILSTYAACASLRDVALRLGVDASTVSRKVKYHFGSVEGLRRAATRLSNRAPGE